MPKAMTRKQERERTVVVTFDCRHTRDFKFMYVPQTGEMIWCLKCHAMAFVTGWKDEYRVKCDKCRFSRRSGQAVLTAERMAGRHHRLNPQHEVTVWYGTNVHHTWTVLIEALMEKGEFTKALLGRSVETVDLPPF